MLLDGVFVLPALAGGSHHAFKRRPGGSSSGSSAEARTTRACPLTCAPGHEYYPKQAWDNGSVVMVRFFDCKVTDPDAAGQWSYAEYVARDVTGHVDEFWWLDDAAGPMIGGNRGCYHAAGLKFTTIRDAASAVGITLA